MGTGREWRVFWQRVEFVRRPPRKTALPALDSEPRDVGSSQVKCDDEGDNPLCRSAKGSWAGIVLLVESKKKTLQMVASCVLGLIGLVPGKDLEVDGDCFSAKAVCLQSWLKDETPGEPGGHRGNVFWLTMNEWMLIHAHYEQLPCAKSKKGFHWQRDRSLMARGSLGTFSNGFAEEAVASGIRSRPWCA